MGELFEGGGLIEDLQYKHFSWILNSKRWGQRKRANASYLGLFLLLACERSAENWGTITLNKTSDAI